MKSFQAAHPIAPWYRRTTALAVIVLLSVLTGCASAPKQRNPVPDLITADNAIISGIPKARVWGDIEPGDIRDRIEKARQRYAADAGRPTDSIDFLALSGGGQNGAFGAGLLNGWTEHGSRPDFRLVTGISTGALIAPFAYLGSDYDDQLKAVYTTISTRDILEKRNRLAGILGDSMASTEPLKELIARYVDQPMLDAIARRYRKGRSLLIGTTNLDAGRPVIWNIGEIADSREPKSLELVREILRASASIPIAFPPVYFEVEANGQRYDEMHVDGGTATQVFLYPPSVNMRKFLEEMNLTGEANIYVIRNALVNLKWSRTKPKLVGIAGRSLSTLLDANGQGDLDRIYIQARKDGLNYHATSIPASFHEQAKEPFDPVYMNKLYNLGYQLAKNGYPWDTVPPGFVVDQVP